MGEHRRSRVRIGKAELGALFKSLQKQLFSRQGIPYVQFLVAVIMRYPRMLPDAVRLAIIGYHLERVSREIFTPKEFASE